MTLELAELKDKEAFLEIVQDLFYSTAYSTVTEFNRSYIEDLFIKSLSEDKQDVCTVLLKDNEKTVGLISMGKGPMPANKDAKIATELAFWILPEYNDFKAKRMLLSAFIFWARKTGCKAALIGRLRSKQAPETYTVRKL